MSFNAKREPSGLFTSFEEATQYLEKMCRVLGVKHLSYWNISVVDGMPDQVTWISTYDPGYMAHYMGQYTPLGDPAFENSAERPNVIDWNETSATDDTIRKMQSQAARFGIAHELGHFLLERHELGIGGTFTCTQGDMRETRTARLNKRQEVEANEFATGLLAPHDLLVPFLKMQPEISAAADLRTKLDISLEAAARCLIERHDEPIAAVWTTTGRIRYSVRGASFPWIERGRGDQVPPSVARPRR